VCGRAARAPAEDVPISFADAFSATSDFSDILQKNTKVEIPNPQSHIQNPAIGKTNIKNLFTLVKLP
jgi:hypothetical protein